MKKIIYITGSRAEYGVVRNFLRELEASGQFLVSLIVTGQHLSHAYGYTFDEVTRDGHAVAAVVDGKVGAVSMPESLGLETAGIAAALISERPDLVLVAGDRDEALAGAMAAAHLAIPVAHISGGDVTTGGTIDERIRHAITRFADVHFAESAQSAANLLKMGENPALVFAVGNLSAADAPVTEAQQEAVAQKYHIDRSAPLLLVGQHPLTTAAGDAGAQMRETLEALRELGLQTVLTYPNADSGSEAMIAEITEYADEPYLRIARHVPHEDFRALMSLASVMVGNSSAALYEAPAFELPAVNIGRRQEGRERADNVIDVPHDPALIIAAVRLAISKDFREKLRGMRNPYHQADTAAEMVAILTRLDLSPALLEKKTVLPR